MSENQSFLEQLKDLGIPSPIVAHYLEDRQNDYPRPDNSQAIKEVVSWDVKDNFENSWNSYAAIENIFNGQALFLDHWSITIKSLLAEKLCGYLSMLEQLRDIFNLYNNHYPTPSPTHKLIWDVFGCKSDEVDFNAVITGHLDIAAIQSREKPFSKKELEKFLFEEIVRSIFNGRWSTFVGQHDEAIVANALATLTKQEEIAIRCEYGFGGEIISRRVIAKLVASDPEKPLSIERVRQIIAKALRKLRHPSRSRAFKVILKAGLAYRYLVISQDKVESENLHHDLSEQVSLHNEKLLEQPFVKSLMEQNKEMAKELSGYHQQAAVIKDPIYLKKQDGTLVAINKDVISASIDTVDGMSTRLYNGLKNADIRNIHDLCLTSRDYLLTRKYMGITTIGEVLDLLERYNLELNMIEVP